LASSVVYARFTPTQVQPRYYIEMGQARNMGRTVIGIVRNLSVIAGVIVIAMIGIKFMFGSVEERAEYQKSFLPIVIGAILVMGATTIVSMLFNITQQ